VANAQPVWIADALNGRPAVRFAKASAQQLLLPTAGFTA
jgi:hypothetical protein